MLSQAGIAAVWGPGCYRGRVVEVRLYGAGVVTVRPSAVPAVLALNNVLTAHRYQTRAADTGGLVCRRKTSGRGMSNHSFGTAVDINWRTNPYGPRLRTDMPQAMVRDILAIRTNSGAQVWGWGGLWRGNKDSMHWELVCTPGQLASGIRQAVTVPPVPEPPVVRPLQLPVEEDEMPFLVMHNGEGNLAANGAAVLVRSGLRYPLDTPAKLQTALHLEKVDDVRIVNQAGWEYYYATTTDGVVA